MHITYSLDTKCHLSFSILQDDLSKTLLSSDDASSLGYASARLFVLSLGNKSLGLLRRNSSLQLVCPQSSLSLLLFFFLAIRERASYRGDKHAKNERRVRKRLRSRRKKNSTSTNFLQGRFPSPDRAMSRAISLFPFFP